MAAQAQVTDYAFMVGEFDNWTRSISENIRVEMKDTVRESVIETFKDVQRWTLTKDDPEVAGLARIIDLPHRDQCRMIDEWLRQVNNVPGKDKFWCDHESGLVEKCCKWYGDKWRSCERHPLMRGQRGQWTVKAECGNETRNVPIYLEISWTCPHS